MSINELPQGLDFNNSVENWESHFSSLLQKTTPSEKNKVGLLLPIIPDQVKWSHFLSTVKSVWPQWKTDYLKNPACLLILYSGLAFYKYDENTFWPQFAEAIGSDHLPANQQHDLNMAFSKVAEDFGLKLKLRDNGTDYVGSAVHFIGIPLSLWGGFLEICKWAVWREDWKNLNDDEWKLAAEKRSGGRKRLKKFLVDNRATASNFIQEMLDARSILMGDTGLSIESIEQASILRQEYFEEVPETAEFLCPQNPDSISKNKARLIWNERKSQICLQLPGVESSRLPAIWTIDSKSQGAACNPDEINLGLLAFQNPLLLKLETKSNIEEQIIHGLDSWGLFDVELGGIFVNPNRDELPLKSYTLISRKEIELQREGFDEEENPLNEKMELPNGLTIYISRLLPTGKYAEIRIVEKDKPIKNIRFRARNTVESRFFLGWGNKAGYFVRTSDNKLKTDHLPIICVSVPNDYFRNNIEEIKKTFKVKVDGRIAHGYWKHLETHTTTQDREFYEWIWGEKPLLEAKSGVHTLSSLSQLGSAFKSSDLSGVRNISVEAAKHVNNIFSVEIINRSNEELDKCWKNLPGDYLTMFLLCQNNEGMKWEDIVLAKDVIAHGKYLSPYLLHKYEKEGYVVLRGHRWFLRESRAVFKIVNNDDLEMNYCGDPSILWGLYRYISNFPQRVKLALIEVKNKRGEIPFLHMVWNSTLKNDIEKYLKKNKVTIGEKLWIH